VFEELAQAPSTSSVRSLVSQAVAELHLGRTEEAQAALDQALKKEPNCTEAIANLLVLTVLTGKDPAELTRQANPEVFPRKPWAQRLANRHISQCPRKSRSPTPFLDGFSREERFV